MRPSIPAAKVRASGSGGVSSASSCLARISIASARHELPGMETSPPSFRWSAHANRPKQIRHPRQSVVPLTVLRLTITLGVCDICASKTNIFPAAAHGIGSLHVVFASSPVNASLKLNYQRVIHGASFLFGIFFLQMSARLRNTPVDNWPFRSRFHQRSVCARNPPRVNPWKEISLRRLAALAAAMHPENNPFFSTPFAARNSKLDRRVKGIRRSDTRTYSDAFAAATHSSRATPPAN